MKLTLLSSVLLVWQSVWAQQSPITLSSTGWYSVVGSSVIRPNWDYHAAVTVEGVSQKTTVVLEITGRQDSGGIFKANQFVTVEPYVTGIIRLQIGEIGRGEYNLTAQGKGGVEFFNMTRLEYQEKSLSVFIQTDKQVYKPGSTVLFRAIVLNHHLKPTVTGPIHVYVTDGEGNRVKEWRRVLTTRGVYSGELELSESPVLGDWTIHVAVLDQRASKTFQVAEYVLPKFEVSLNVPQHALNRDSQIVADIRAKYTYGRPVKGEATISMYPSYFAPNIQLIHQNIVRKVIPIDGKAVAEFDIKELNLTEDYERMINFEVTVEEKLTGRRQNTSAFTMIHKNKYHLELVKTSDFFKPGLKHIVYVKVTQYDGTPVINSNIPAKIKSGYTSDYESYEETSHEVSPSGLIKLTFYPPTNATIIGIDMSYGGVTEWTTLNAAVSPSKNYIQAYLLTENPQVNSDIEVEVNMTENVRSVNYQVIGRGDVILAHTVTVRPDSRTALWRFRTTSAMSPKANLIVYYIRSDGEVVADTVTIEMESTLQNFVRVRPNINQTEPGSNIELSIESKPNSYIGLLGVDQSVLLLKKGNDITKEDVFNELGSYDNSVEDGRDRRFGFTMDGAFTAKLAFQNAGTVVLTNGFVYERTPWRQMEWSRKAENRPIGRPWASSPTSWIKPDLGPKVAYQPNTRPPLAGPYAFSRIPRPVFRHPRLFLNKPIQGTWLFANTTSDFNGRTTLRKNVPDTITSWVISAFSIDDISGLGLMDAPTKVRVFRPFFISLDLPYSIIRGETVTIPVVVFNYMDEEMTADVTLNNSGQFEFTDVTNDINAAPKIDFFRRKQVKIPPNTGQSTSFMITALEVGYIDISITAKSAVAGDKVLKKLLVKPEGEPQYKNEAIFVDLRGTSDFKTNVTLKFPENYVADSEFIEVSAVGDLLGPSVMNLDQLIKMPFGCGEQNMLNFVPNIVVLDYLKNTGKISPAVESKCKHFIEKGYQQELTYRHKDGSFSAFGNSDPSGSTWLTAFVVKSFAAARSYTDVELRVLDEGLAWLASHQSPNGSFPEVGTVSHKDMQGGSSEGLALTAFTLLAFLTHKSQTHSNNVNRAIDYIVRRVDSIKDPYALAITTYALHVASHPAKNAAFNLLETKSKSSPLMKFWTRNERESDKENPNSLLPNSVDVEMTAYCLLTYLERGLDEDALPIMRWLISQQNSEGGFASTQDTVVGLMALSKIAERIFAKTSDVSVTFSYGKGLSSSINVNPSNSIILQKVELPKKVREVNITASGSGFAVVQISYRYNVNVTGAWPLFNLDPQVDKNSNVNHLQLSICSNFVGGVEGTGSEESNMAVMEVSLPSGYTVDQDSLPSLQSSQHVKRVETRMADTQVVLYFDKMTRDEYCPTVSAFRTHKVAKQRPVPVSIYDYYDQSRKARVFYSPLVATECDICEGDDCKDCSTVTAGSREGGGAAAVTAPALITFLLVTCTLIRLR